MIDATVPSLRPVQRRGLCAIVRTVSLAEARMTLTILGSSHKTPSHVDDFQAICLGEKRVVVKLSLLNVQRRCQVEMAAVQWFRSRRSVSMEAATDCASVWAAGPLLFPYNHFPVVTPPLHTSKLYDVIALS
jgi:hypothetical protein